jgi:hypothetical protein
MARTVADRLERASEFFMKRADVHRALDKIERRLAEENIDYAVIGGMALNIHGYERVTNDVDLLTTRVGLDAIHERLAGRGYVPSFSGARKRLRDTESGVTIEFITTGEYPGDGKPKPVSFPDPRDASINREGHQVIVLPKLVELKLASGLTAADRIKDLADVQELIKVVKLPRDLGEQLDPSVRDEYYRMWDAAQNAWDPSAG